MKRDNLKPGAVAHARSLRRPGTPQERILWQTLRRHAAHARFRRQAPIGPYFVDFISHGAKLVVELDGAHHAGQQDYDADRTRFLEAEGYRVLRFWNRDIKQNLDGVFRAIETALAEPTSPLVGEGGPKGRMRGAQRSCAPASGRHPSPQPSPTRGEGDLVNLPVGVR
jgi:very-short-patch-repair endonuclease